MTRSPRKQLGLIGLGAFGRFAAVHLCEHFDVVAHDVDPARAADAETLGIDWVSLGQAAALPYVVLAVPVQSFDEVLTTIRDFVQPGSLVIDVASVKLATTAAMSKMLPEEVEIIGTHPMFGPQSAAGGLVGHRIVVCPVRTSRLEQVRAFLEQLGLRVHVCDADTHDRDIAHTQALAQFVGRALAMLDESDSPVRTPGYDRFREVAETVGDDSWELFTAIQNLNPYAAGMRAELLGYLDELQRRLIEEADDGGPAEIGEHGTVGDDTPTAGSAAAPTGDRARQPATDAEGRPAEDQ